jgi:hypothetical protein
VVAHAKDRGDEEPLPMELRMAWQCERWQALPEAGGLSDQDYRLMNRMSAFANVHGTIARLRDLHGAAIHSLTGGERKLIRWLMDAGLYP